MNFPFQFSAGSQTSILMSDSFVGVRVAVTRQNPGRFFMAALARSLAPGIVNAPAATIRAEVIAVFGSLTAARLSQETAAAAAEGSRKLTAAAATSVTSSADFGVITASLPSSDGVDISRLFAIHDFYFFFSSIH